MFPINPATMYNPQYPNHHLPSPGPQKPKVGLAVVCRCCLGNTYVQCLLQKRGAHSCSPHKWSFPGGRLEQPGDLEDDGAVGTKRTLEEECGGGAPPGLPPLIHIECCKSGKMKQTLYHVFVVDTSAEKEWENWQPKPKIIKPTEVDIMSGDLIIQGQPFRSINGYSWVDMSVLIEECFGLNTLDNTDLQHGLVRWVNNYGEHILKTLLARSPKIPHTRRLSNTTAPANGFGNVTTVVRPRAPRPDHSTGKPRRYSGSNVRATLLQPPYLPGQIVRPMFQGSPTHSAFYRITPPHNSGQLSPTGSGGTSGAMGSPLGVNNVVGGIDNVPGVVVPIPHHPGQTNVMFFHQMSNQIQLSTENQSSINLQQQQQQQSTPGIFQQAPGLLQHTPGLVRQSSSEGFNPSNQPFALTCSPSHRISEITEGAAPISSHIPTSLQVQSSRLVAEVSPTPVIAPSTHTLPPNHQNLDPHQISMLGPGHISSAAALGNHEQALLPSSMSQLPPPLGDKAIIGVSNGPPVSVRTADSGPLLPNPPQPIIPHMPIQSRMPPHIPKHSHPLGAPQQQQNPRKDTICKHYLSGTGQCPFGDKCWFAHPDPMGFSQPPLRWENKAAASTAFGPTLTSQPSSPQLPGQNLWMNNQNEMVAAGVPQYYVASPQLNSVVPSAQMGNLPQYRPTYPIVAGQQQQQQPLVFVRPQRAENQQLPGSTYPMLPNPSFSGVPMPQNPVLRFDLLTDLRIQDVNGYTVTNISQQASRADHLYVSFGAQIYNYKILFGGNRPCTQSFYLTDEKNLSEIVSCVHSSRQQQALLVVGTEAGSVSLWDLRRGMGHGNMTEVYRTIAHPQVPSKPEEAITSLIHFSTSIANYSVIVSGTRGGTLSWYISQPPQKTFSLLFSDSKMHSQQSVNALQVLGGYLVSGDVSGRVILWSMQTQCPFVQSSFVAHSLTLSGLHVIDNTHFITVGTGPISTDENSLGGVERNTPSGGHEEGKRPSLQPDSLLTDMSRLSVGNTTASVTTAAASSTGTMSSHEPNRYSVCLWQFNNPPKFITSIPEEGVVVSTSFHCHTPPGNMFLAVGLQGGTIKIYNVPNFTVASELHFLEMKGMSCSHVTLNHSRETPIINQAYFRNPFRDLILTTVWSDGRIMVCQVARQ